MKRPNTSRVRCCECSRNRAFWMKILDIRSQLLSGFPEIKYFFAIGENRFSLSDTRELLREAGAPAGPIAGLTQIHGNRVIRAALETAKFPQGDALYSDLPNLYLMVRTADCLPILFYNKAAGIIGAVHAGRRGTQKGVLKAAVETVMEKHTAPISDFVFFLGPAAQACCYEVNMLPARADGFAEFYSDYLTVRDGKTYLDFVGANIQQLQEMGVGEQQIENSAICTIHNHQYPSHRRQQGKRHEILISLIGRHDFRGTQN